MSFSKLNITVNTINPKFEDKESQLRFVTLVQMELKKLNESFEYKLRDIIYEVISFQKERENRNIDGIVRLCLTGK